MDGDASRSHRSSRHWQPVRTATHQLTLESVELHLVEQHEVVHPLVLHEQRSQRARVDGGVISVAQRRDALRATARLQDQSMLLCDLVVRDEGVALQPVVQRVHEQHEEQRSEGVALPETPLHSEGSRQAIGRSHARRQTCETVSDEHNERFRELQASQRALQHLGLHAVVGLHDVVEQRVQLTPAGAAVLPRVQQLIDALRDAAAAYEAALSRVQHSVFCEDLSQPHSQHQHEELAEAALQADGPNVLHRALLLRVLHQRDDDTRLPG